MRWFLNLLLVLSVVGIYFLIKKKYIRVEATDKGKEKAEAIKGKAKVLIADVKDKMQEYCESKVVK